MMRILLVIITATLGWVSAALCAPVGTFEVDGVMPGTSQKYSGIVLVERAGEKYRVVWQVNGQERTGVALGGAVSQGTFMIGPAHPDDLMLAIGYSDGKTFGTATMFLQQGGVYEGFLVQSDGETAGQETWTPVN
ncbi:MAG: hypothetical protein AAF334_02685 [Pseudomonadota bacterium]